MASDQSLVCAEVKRRKNTMENTAEGDAPANLLELQIDLFGAHVARSIFYLQLFKIQQWEQS